MAAAVASPKGRFSLPPLPYTTQALAPYTSERTLQIHHGKHHAAYVANLNAALEKNAGQRYAADLSLEDIILKSHQEDKADGPVFNNAGQHWNHSFFWQCQKPGGGGAPPVQLSSALSKNFGSVGQFKESFKSAAPSQFGSGWAWLVREGDVLKVVRTPNAVTPIVYGQFPLLVCDVWEHAYYLDYNFQRGDFVTAFLEHLVNWDFVADRLAQSDKAAQRA